MKNIVYKVVGKRHRYGSNLTMFFERFPLFSGAFRSWKRKNKEYWKELKPYFPKYLKGSLIEEVKGSKGIMCFYKKEDAEKFIFKNFLYKGKEKIVKVQGIGRKKKVKFLKSGCGFDIRYLLEKYKEDIESNNITGFVSFPSVKVLE
jgi:hypothetical protein